MESLGNELGRVLRKSNEHESNISNTNQSIEDFLNEINNVEFQKDILKERIKTGFIARPFDSQFDKIGENISRYFQAKKIFARHFDANLHGGLIINQIIAQIRDSHFCIADISGNNPNVLLEVGIMIAENKPIRILQHYDIKQDAPFNVNGYQIYKYKTQSLSNKLLVAYPGEERFRDFKVMIDSFMCELEENGVFANSKPYEEDQMAN